MHPPPLLIMDVVGPAIGALVFVVIMSLVSEPARRTINAMIVAGASGAYLSGGGFGIWEVVYPVVAMPIAYRGLRSYSFIGLAWLMHSCWDIVHHLWEIPSGRSCRPRRSAARSSTRSSQSGLWPVRRPWFTGREPTRLLSNETTGDRRRERQCGRPNHHQPKR